ncbi:DegT/DnrJ/EryC1/StrS family aminotransferase [Candidatus Nitronereus thalassa]|uniref:DegT/DnrJ/EryC1/StrS family aminotransferase n=1 Tax=Candidatus Nitronereus thalassa TaxID=3020898 RepID=A0ABU3K569_9BACT|nr:DegT/DnrJ/EryC1/StrS family aminotransferase [Candidatus Nitronereus thalassa]MDT7041518.1 DegT/DnrJ/EryC1/StrS family aminotransferase [Candidatus Nitronereus thalassa]
MSIQSLSVSSLPHIRPQFLSYHVPSIGEEEIRSVVETLRSGWLTTGAKVKQFEQDFGAKVCAQHAVALNSCTAALHLALEAVGVKEGDEVIVPTMTFAATGEVVTYLGAKPILIDCRPDDLTLDVTQIEKLITPRTKAIIPVHFAGHPCEMIPLMELAKAYNLRVIEDAAHALPAWYQGVQVGSIGDITCFSFYATKTITTGEGGMATTQNETWADKMRMMSLHGISRNAWSRYSANGSWSYDICHAGHKYNLTDLAASLGIEQLKKCDQFQKTREQYAGLYNQGFKDLPEIIRPSVADNVQHAWHLYVMQLDVERLRIGRNEFIEILKNYNIGTSVHFIPLHLHPYYRQTFGYQPEDFPNARACFERIISLPIYPKMTEADIEYVIEVVREIIRTYRR